ncbi:MAG: TonB-dependent receptor [Flavipsychrobacter sp.]
MLKRIAHIILFLAIATSGYAQTLRVTVLDNSTGKTVPFAYINISSINNNGTIINAQTDENGVANVSPDIYPCVFELTALGYESLSKEVLTAPAGNVLNIRMTKKFSSMNEVVVTGMAQPMRLKDALSNYRVIGKEQIKAQGAVTLDEILENQLNMSIGNDQVLGATMNMQGLKGDKVKILIDGIPLNGRENGNIDLSQINLNNVERVEIVQGPMSVVYGTDALGGVINIITKKEKKPLSINAGTYLETYKYNFDATASFKLADRHQITLGGGRNYFKGWKYIDQVQRFGTQELRTQRNLLFNPKEQYIANLAYRYEAKSGFRVDLASDYLREKVTDRGDVTIWTTAGAYATDRYYRTTRSMNRLSMQGKIGKKGQWQSQNGYIVYNRTRATVSKDMVALSEVPTAAKGDQDTSTFSDVFLRGNYTNQLQKLQYTVGYDVNLQFAKSLKIDGHNKELHDYAVYANVSYPLIKDKLTGQVGLRGAANTTYSPPVIPSANLLYTPKKNLQIRASYAQGFRAPSLKEKYLSFVDANHNIVGSPNLRAESSQHVQVSASYQAYEERSDYLQFIVTGFFNDVKDGILLVPVNPLDSNSLDYTYGNQTHQSNAIGSVQMDGQWKQFHFQIGYALTNVFAEPNSYDAFTAQEATATLQYAWKKPGLRFNAFYKYTGSQPTATPNIDGSISYNGTQDAFSMLDVSVSKKFLKNKVQIIAGVKNLLDVQLVQTRGAGINSGGAHSGGSGGINLLPRTVFTSIRVALNKY